MRRFWILIIGIIIACFAFLRRGGGLRKVLFGLRRNLKENGVKKLLLCRMKGPLLQASVILVLRFVVLFVIYLYSVKRMALK